jgi:SAM-dependent methyltransferase
VSWWDAAYRGGEVPWDPGPFDGHLPGILGELDLRPCRVLDLGCGSGKSLVWLAQRGFECWGIDLSPAALRQAESNARAAGVACAWLKGRFPDDFPRGRLPGSPFGFVMERGCLQHLRHDGRELRGFLEAAANVLQPQGWFYSLVTSSNRRARHVGPPQWSAAHLVAAVEPFFEIRLLRESVFTHGEQGSVPAWLLLAQRRDLRPRTGGLTVLT